MMERISFEDTGRFIRKHCDTDDYIFRISQTESHETRFAQNAITQHMAGTNCRVELTVAFGNKTGSASTNQLDDASLRALVDTARQIAMANQPDPEYIPSEPERKVADITNFSEETADVSVEDIVGNIRKCVDNADARSAKVSGMVGKHLQGEYVATKNGFTGFDRSSSFSHSMTLKRDDVETKVSRGVKNLADFDLDDLLEQLNLQFDSLQKPEPMDAQKIPVILRPEAVMNLFDSIYAMMDMRDADEGVSPFTGQFGKQFFGDRFTLKSVLDDSALLAPTFSNSGLPSVPTTWINGGVIENLPTTRYYAKLKGLEATFPFNAYIEGGDSTEQEMIDRVDRGLIINNFWYIRFVDRKRGELTGMTRDGVLYFENGKIKHAVNNFRWNEVLHEATRRIGALGKSVPHSSDARIPTMLIDSFNLVDTTRF